MRDRDDDALTKDGRDDERVRELLYAELPDIVLLRVTEDRRAARRVREDPFNELAVALEHLESVAGSLRLEVVEGGLELVLGFPMDAELSHQSRRPLRRRW
jgi:hypothetical protein